MIEIANGCKTFGNQVFKKVVLVSTTYKENTSYSILCSTGAGCPLYRLIFVLYDSKEKWSF